MAAGHDLIATPIRDHVVAAVKAYEAGNSEDLDLIVEVLCLCEDAKHALRTKGYGWTGLDIMKTVALVPYTASEVAYGSTN